MQKPNTQSVQALVISRIEDLIIKSESISDVQSRDKEVTLFLKWVNASDSLNKAIAYKRWKDHINNCDARTNEQ